MKKVLTFIVISFFLSAPLFSQVEDRFSFLTEKNVVDYAKPFATTLGTAFNSGGYHSASVSKFFGFSLSFRGMYIMVPDDQLTFSPSLPNGYTASKPTATIYGNKGGAYAGPDGYIPFPPGINESAVPVAYPQVTGSFMGTELLIRYLPSVDIGETSIGFFGAGLKHSISQYIPLFPLDMAVQVMYSNFSLKDIIDANNFAANVHVSKTFGVFIPYFGLQYESTGVELKYTIQGDPNSGDPNLRVDKPVSVDIDGDNNFRATLGGALKLAIIVLNADVSLSSQTVFSGGLTFEF
ncbi:MAG: hypothetical protein IPM56_15645 [Ignavibacteriales bacterium]|nr:MAG: hypothetical protein IPM56_15645 [Ignavibacteriales bacterium]